MGKEFGGEIRAARGGRRICAEAGNCRRVVEQLEPDWTSALFPLLLDGFSSRPRLFSRPLSTGFAPPSQYISLCLNVVEFLGNSPVILHTK